LLLLPGFIHIGHELSGYGADSIAVTNRASESPSAPELADYQERIVWKFLVSVASLLRLRIPPNPATRLPV
jgi:hypothetical protein